MIVDSKSFRVMKKWIVRNSIKDERDIRLLPFLSIEFSERVNNKRNRNEFTVRNKIVLFSSRAFESRVYREGNYIKIREKKFDSSRGN